MTPIELRAHGFKTFRQPLRFKFPQRAGLYFMRGDNRLEPRLGGNGAGKSSIWDALTWLFWDKTPRGLGAGNVGTWGSPKGAWVELDYLGHDGLTWTARRQWGPNQWTLTSPTGKRHDLAKGDADLLLQELRLDAQSWLHAVVLAQGRPMFLDLKPEDKAQLFSRVLGLEKWADLSARASARSTEQDRHVREAEQALAAAQSRLQTVQDAGTADALPSQEWEDARAQELRDLECRYKATIDVANELGATLKERTAQLDAHRKAGHPYWADAVSDQEDKVAWLRDAVSTAATDVRDARAELKRAEAAEEAIKHLDQCPTCRQAVPPNHRTHLLGLASTEADRVGAEVLRLAAALTAVDDQLHAAADLLDELRRGQTKWREKLDDRERAVAMLRRDHQLEERRLDDMEAQAQQIEARRNPHAQAAHATQERLKDAQRGYEQASRALDDARARYLQLNVWVAGFKDIRLVQIAGALAELEAEVNSNLTELGLPDWTMLFAVDKETKRGTVQRGFNVLVQSPANAEAVPWEAWSGGEGQRLRLAGELGLSDLIRTRTGCSLPLEVLDEPTAGMSPQGIEDLLDALVTRATRENRCIWLVDHHSLAYGGFAGITTVIKDENGSRIAT